MMNFSAVLVGILLGVPWEPTLALDHCDCCEDPPDVPCKHSAYYIKEITECKKDGVVTNTTGVWLPRGENGASVCVPVVDKECCERAEVIPEAVGDCDTEIEEFTCWKDGRQFIGLHAIWNSEATQPIA